MVIKNLDVNVFVYLWRDRATFVLSLKEKERKDSDELKRTRRSDTIEENLKCTLSEGDLLSIASMRKTKERQMRQVVTV